MLINQTTAGQNFGSCVLSKIKSGKLFLQYNDDALAEIFRYTISTFESLLLVYGIMLLFTL